MGRPALSDEERAQRRGQLLAAARPLFHASRDLPSVAAIAEAAGVAKGSIYLSFNSKEHIFVALLEESFGTLLFQLSPHVSALPADAPRAATRFATAYTEIVMKTPDLLPLAGMTNAVLERNLPLPAMLALKKGLASGLNAAGEALSRSALKLDHAQAVDLLLHTWSITLGLWQILDAPRELRPLLQRRSLTVFHRDFRTELQRVVRIFWLGTLLSQRGVQRASAD